MDRNAAIDRQADTLAGDHGGAAFSTLDGGYLDRVPSAW
jgi:hypothetical protein